MIRIAVAEDDLSWARQLQTYVDQYARESGKSFEVSLFADGEDLMEQYHGQFDLIFLDVQMRFLDGMATAELIRRTDPEVIIIFITNMAQYAIRGYEVDALDYMLKPVGYATFVQRLGRALSRMRRRERTYITVPIKGGAMKLAVEDITFVESQGHRLIYHTAEEEYVSAGTIKDAEEKLEGYHFFRSNKGYLLNLEHVDGIQDNCALVGEHKLLISRARKNAFLEALTAYMGGGAR